MSIALVGVAATSCVDPDPAAVYGTSTNTPTSTNGNISGPRIVTKFEKNNVAETEYISSANGKLQVVKQHNNPDDQVAYGSNNKISTITLDAQDPNRNVLYLNYDTSGRVTTAKQQVYQNSALNSTTDAVLTYDTAGKLIKVEKKLRFDAVATGYTQYNIIDITYTGQNVTMVKDSPGMIMNGAMQPIDPALVQTYLFKNFDTKINPLTTLSKEYNIGMGIFASMNLGNLSYNNFFQTSAQLNATMQPIVINMAAYNYDPQDYPISDQPNVTKIYYKPVL